MRTILLVCMLLVIVGGLNWLSIGVSKHLDANLVAKLNNETAERTIYIVIGVSALVLLVAKVLKLSGLYNPWNY